MLSIFAIKFALAANRTAEMARQETKDASDKSHAMERDRDARDQERDVRNYAREQARDARDRDRERRELAGSVAAWWAASYSELEPRYGIVVSNQSTTNAVFFDVEVRAKCFKDQEQSLRMKVLPPGRFFVQQSKINGKIQLERIPHPVQEDDALEPFTVAGDRSVEEIRYSDGLGARWQWSSGAGLAEVNVDFESAGQ
ncbi:hypothetical protein ITJ61_17595 [Pseudoclavibacter sp. VKM Ac-2888]|nr:hypothetical protein [Pseudoclavibacter sp. VKM Ac-2888]